MRIDRRPFATVADHDASLIRIWNETVQEKDQVWHLGDFARGTMDQVAELLSKLNGHKHLIIGNNDSEATLKARGWSSVQHYKELIVEDRLIILCHYPFRTWNQMGRRAIDLHGHSHARLKPMPRQYDVGVDAWSFRPVTLQTLVSSRQRRTTPPN